MTRFVKLNEAKDQILGDYTYGSSFRDKSYTSFGPEGIPDQDFFDRGLYKLIEGDLPLPEGKTHGARHLAVEGNAVTITHDIVDIPAAPKVATVDSLLDLLERDNILTPAQVSELRG